MFPLRPAVALFGLAVALALTGGRMVAAAEPGTTVPRAADGPGPWHDTDDLPGLNNRRKDAAGRPMKNWWPFLFF